QDILVRHINLCSQHAGALLEIAFAHPVEECPVLSRSSLTVRAINAQPMIVSAVLSDFFGALTVDVGQASIDQFEGELVKLLEVVRSVEDSLARVESQPNDVRDNSVRVELILCERVGVIEPQVARAA